MLPQLKNSCCSPFSGGICGSKNMEGELGVTGNKNASGFSAGGVGETSISPLNNGDTPFP